MLPKGYEPVAFRNTRIRREPERACVCVRVRVYVFACARAFRDCLEQCYPRYSVPGLSIYSLMSGRLLSLHASSITKSCPSRRSIWACGLPKYAQKMRSVVCVCVYACAGVCICVRISGLLGVILSEVLCNRLLIATTIGTKI